MKNISEYLIETKLQDYGLNADWSISLYHLGNEYYLFDNEDGSYELVKMEDPYNEEHTYESLQILDNSELKQLLLLIKE